MLRTARTLPVCTSQSQTVPWLPAASVLPSGLYATDTTVASPLKVSVALAVSTFHMLIGPFQVPAAKILPSGLNATECTLTDSRVARTLPVFTSHSLTVSSALPDASVLPSGLYAAENTERVCPLR